MSSRTSTGVVVAAGVAVLAGGALLGLYALGRSEERRLTHEQRSVSRKVRIPVDKVGLVIGRRGDNIREVERKSNTRIHMVDELLTESERVLEIRGRSEDVTLAEVLIFQTLQNQPKLETLKMRIPDAAVGRVIGAGGETIRAMQNQTRCKVDVDKLSDGENLTAVNLRGTSDQVATARCLIEDIVREHEKRHGRISAAVENGGSIPRTPRLTHRQPLFLTSDSPSPSVEVLSAPRKDQYERLQPVTGFQRMGVYVANMIDPERFFVQKTGSASIELDKLVQEMSTFYEDELNRSLFVVIDPSVGDLVAAQFPGDGQFYRAKVTDVIVDSYDEDKVEVDVEFVDFGDAGRKSTAEVFELKTEFLKLNFQAIECSLHNVKPNGDSWSNESLDFFESITHMAQWKDLNAEVMSFKTVGTMRIPVLQLISHHSGENVNIADELVKNGHAFFVNTSNEDEENSVHE